MKSLSVKLETIIARLCVETKNFTPPLVDQIISEYGKKPFLILISCLLSLRAKDTTTIHVCQDLFKIAQTPKKLLAIPILKLEKILFKVGFYRNKAQVLRHVSKVILKKYDNTVPSTFEELLKLKGIGRKTANLVIGLAFRKPSICADIHVHRISNRLGLVTTKTPDETEFALQKILPKKYWIKWNKLLVTWGQNVCTSRNPKCTECALKNVCNHGKQVKA